jgi:hypothetical protein
MLRLSRPYRQLSDPQLHLRVQNAAAGIASGPPGAVKKEGCWKVLRGNDKHKNEYLYLRHEGSKLLVELPSHSTGLFLYRSGAGAPARACSQNGNIAPFQTSPPFTVGSIARRLDAGEGKSLGKKNVKVGNWKLVALDDHGGNAVATNDSQFVKTSKNKDGDGAAELLKGMGMELHFSSMGQLMWLEPETQGDKAILISSHDAPKQMSRNEAVKWLGADDGIDTGDYEKDDEEEEQEEADQEGEEEEDVDAPAGDDDDDDDVFGEED